MNILELISTLNTENVQLALEGDDLSCVVPHESYQISAQLQQAINEHKSDLIYYLQGLQQSEEQVLEPVPKEQREKGSHHRIWFIDELEPGIEFTYDNTGTVHFYGKLNPDLLAASFNDTITRHEKLQCCFDASADPAKLAENDSFNIEFMQIDIESEDEVEKYIAQPTKHIFDPMSGRIIMLNLLKRSDEEYVLMFNTPHNNGDSESIDLLFEGVKAFYRGHLLVPHALQSAGEQANFGHWQNNPADVNQNAHIA